MTNDSRFRILIMGRANAGKTTILKKICSETETPIVRNKKGKIIQSPDSLNPTARRGVHNIDYEITYPSRPGLVFHDSCGLECGSEGEMDKIFEFIKRRATAKEDKKLDLIWYCISSAEARPLPREEERFFHFNTGIVPVFVIFTKYDALETKALNELQVELSLPLPEALGQMTERAEDIFQTHYARRLEATPRPPAGHIRLKNLHLTGKCEGLVEATATIVTHSLDRRRFVMANQYDLEVRAKFAFRDALDRSNMGTPYYICQNIFPWFPHVYNERAFTADQRESYHHRFLRFLGLLEGLSWKPIGLRWGGRDAASGFWATLPESYLSSHIPDNRRSREDAWEFDRRGGAACLPASRSDPGHHCPLQIKKLPGDLLKNILGKKHSPDWRLLWDYTSYVAIVVIADSCLHVKGMSELSLISLWKICSTSFVEKHLHAVVKALGSNEKLFPRVVLPSTGEVMSCLLECSQYRPDLDSLVAIVCERAQSNRQDEERREKDLASLQTWKNGPPL